MISPTKLLYEETEKLDWLRQKWIINLHLLKT